jgi:hypothetical protein
LWSADGRDGAADDPRLMAGILLYGLATGPMSSRIRHTSKVTEAR